MFDFEIVEDMSELEDTGVGQGVVNDLRDTLPQTYSRKDLTYCKFCNEWYNEYHFGQPDNDAD